MNYNGFKRLFLCGFLAVSCQAADMLDNAASTTLRSREVLWTRVLADKEAPAPQRRRVLQEISCNGLVSDKSYRAVSALLYDRVGTFPESLDLPQALARDPDKLSVLLASQLSGSSPLPERSAVLLIQASLVATVSPNLISNLTRVAALASSDQTQNAAAVALAVRTHTNSAASRTITSALECGGDVTDAAVSILMFATPGDWVHTDVVKDLETLLIGGPPGQSSAAAVVLCRIAGQNAQARKVVLDQAAGNTIQATPNLTGKTAAIKFAATQLDPEAHEIRKFLAELGEGRTGFAPSFRKRPAGCMALVQPRH